MPTILRVLLCVSLLLQPVQCLRLPANLQAPDLAAFMWLALAAPWLHARGRARPLPLFGPFVVFFGSSAVAAAFSADPVDSAMALVVEAWLYTWFAALTIALTNDEARVPALALGCWIAAGVANGLFVLAQFARPDLQATASAALGSFGALDPYRPSGFFENCNSAAFFQLSALAPLAALRPRRIVAFACSAVLLTSLLATGSMGGLFALAAGTATALGAVLVLQRSLISFVKGTLIVAALATLAASALLAAALADPGFATRVDYVMTGRGEGSAQSRMTLWARGVELLQADFLPFGIGPDRFQAVAGFGMHNDVLATAVERGIPGLAAALGFALTALLVAARMAMRGALTSDRTAVVPIAALAACAALSTTHEILHQRPLWLLLALLCAMDQRRCAFTICSTAAMTCSTSASSMRE